MLQNISTEAFHDSLLPEIVFWLQTILHNKKKLHHNNFNLINSDAKCWEPYLMYTTNMGNNNNYSFLKQNNLFFNHLKTVWTITWVLCAANFPSNAFEYLSICLSIYLHWLIIFEYNVTISISKHLWTGKLAHPKRSVDIQNQGKFNCCQILTWSLKI